MVLESLQEKLTKSEKTWLNSIGMGIKKGIRALDWAASARNAAFAHLSRIIVLSDRRQKGYPKNALRSDEIIWGRAPARLDIGGGWTDTPPYSLEHGGCVINAAVNLNGQAPIHVYLRITKKHSIRINSIDHGMDLTITKLDDLLDYRQATSKFGLAKAALVLSGFSPNSADWPKDVKTLKQMLQFFGGGIELTTLAAIPSGSGLGTSSILGSVLIAVINRLIGKQYTQRELFHSVLQLEQELTTGGGWQDQIGGAVPGIKVISTDPGLIPAPRIHFVPNDLLDPVMNNGKTLLYYTGLRRLAKNILQHVVGNYLDRNRDSLETLKKLHSYPQHAADALSRKDMKRFGELLDVAWQLNKQIDPDSTTETVEQILQKLHPYIYGAKLLGAGGGGFLLLICKSPEAAEKARTIMEKEPPNERARFFDYNISSEGLVVSVC
jgi:galactokinase/mevalonate kinase-like predicted kinase